MPALSSGVSWTPEPEVTYDFGSMPQPRDDIARARDLLGLTQEALAARARVSVRTVARLEAGKPINLGTARKIAGAMSMPITFITDPAAAPTAAPRLSWSEFLERVLRAIGEREIAPEAEERLRFAYDEIVRRPDRTPP